MKKILLIIVLALICGHVRAQRVNVDSMIRVALSDPDINYNHSSNKDSLFSRLPFAKSPTERITIIYEIINYGEVTSTAGLNYHYKVLGWAQKNSDRVSEAVITAEIGPDIAANGDLPEGIKTCLHALKLAEQTGNIQAIGIGYQDLGVCYFNNNTDLYKFYTEKALKYSLESKDDLLVNYELGSLSDIYARLHKIDSAKYYGSRHFQWAVSHHVHSDIAGALITFALLQKDSVQLKYFRIAEKIAISQLHGFRFNYTYAMDAIAKYFLRHNNSDSALYYARKEYNATRTFALNLRYSPALLMAGCFKGNADSTLKYTLEYYKIRDSVQSIGKIERAQFMAFADEQNRRKIQAEKTAYQATLRFYVLAVVIGFLLLLALIFWRNNKKNKAANKLLQQQKEQIQQTLHELKAAQTQLIQSEKMASLGDLTAGIAHEIQNPLNFVNNFSEVSTELVDELDEELNKGDIAEARTIASDIKQNLGKIRHHGKRADFIVKGMLEHSRKSTGEKQPTDMNVLCDEFLKLAYHGMRARDKSFNAEMITWFDPDLPTFNVSQQDIGRVMLNLFNNAFYAVHQKAKTAGADYKPTVELSTAASNGRIEISIKDNGIGIPDAIMDKIMQPFFTTKPTGEGTGLGLSLTYDMVVKGHGGSISLNSKEGEYTEFMVCLPITGSI